MNRKELIVLVITLLLVATQGGPEIVGLACPSFVAFRHRTLSAFRGASPGVVHGLVRLAARWQVGLAGGSELGGAQRWQSSLRILCGRLQVRHRLGSLHGLLLFGSNFTHPVLFFQTV